MYVLPAAITRNRKPGRPAARRKRPEEELQMRVCKFLSVALAGNSVFFHVPNGGLRSAREAKRFKAMGVLAGVPDLAIINDGRIIWIELKASDRKPTENQSWCHERLRLARCQVSVCRSLEEVDAALRAAGVPLRSEPLIRRDAGCG